MDSEKEPRPHHTGRDGTTFNFIASKLRNTHVLGISTFDFPHKVKTWIFKFLIIV